MLAIGPVSFPNRTPRSINRSWGSKGVQLSRRRRPRWKISSKSSADSFIINWKWQRTGSSESSGGRFIISTIRLRQPCAIARDTTVPSW